MGFQCLYRAGAIRARGAGLLGGGWPPESLSRLQLQQRRLPVAGGPSCRRRGVLPVVVSRAVVDGLVLNRWCTRWAKSRSSRGWGSGPHLLGGRRLGAAVG